MGISSAIASATSGLFATARSAQAVSDNVSNALTPGYAAREVVLATGQFGGVGVTTIARRETLSLITDRRMAEADTAGERARSQSLSKVVDLVGSADDSGSLSGRVATFAASLTAAASLPSSDQRLETVLTSAQALVTHLNKAGDGIQAERLAADHAIGDALDALNQGLQRVEELNRQIAKQTATNGDVNTLLDQRRAVIDGISEFIPVREFPRENGRVGLITETGAVLLLDSAAEIGFEKSGGMTPGMTTENSLSGLTINGRAIDTTREGGPIAGGQIAALFELRDEKLPEAQACLDAFAAEFVTRFQSSATDPSLETDPAPGAQLPGLFTDAGDVFASVASLAQRISVNDAVNPDTDDGELWRLRDGVGATVAGPAGDARVLKAFASGLERASVPGDSALGTSSLGLGALADLVVGSAAGAAIAPRQTLAIPKVA